MRVADMGGEVFDEPRDRVIAGRGDDFMEDDVGDGGQGRAQRGNDQIGHVFDQSDV
jgi:hypothetical protein